MSYSPHSKAKTFFDAQACTDAAVYSAGKDTRGAAYDEVVVNATTVAASGGLVVTIEDSEDGSSYLSTGIATSAIDTAGITRLAITRALRRFLRLKAVCASGKTATVSAILPYSEPRSAGAAGNCTDS